MSGPQPEVFVRPTRYEVSALPEDHLFGHLLTVDVEYRGDGLWAVTLPRVRAVLSVEGEWSYEIAASERTDEWLAAHRFDADTALRLAREKALTLTARGKTAAEHLAGRESQG